MRYPQTTAQEIGANCENIGKYGCLAMCYTFCMGVETDETEYIRILSRAINNGYLDNECTVLDAEKYIEYISGRKVTVKKQKITSIENIIERTPVAFEYNNNKHWVVVENGKIVFNSLINSVCVTKGKPAEARIIKYA